MAIMAKQIIKLLFSSQLHPVLIGANMLTIYPDSKLYGEIQRGNWKEESETEMLSVFKVTSVTLAKLPMVSISGKYLCTNSAISISFSYFITNGFAPVRKVRVAFLPPKERYIFCASFKSE